MSPPSAPFAPTSSRASAQPTITKPSSSTPSSAPGTHSHLTRIGFQPRRRRSAGTSPAKPQPKQPEPDLHMPASVPSAPLRSSPAPHAVRQPLRSAPPPSPRRCRDPRLRNRPSPPQGRAFVEREERWRDGDDDDDDDAEPLDRPEGYQAPADEGNCWEMALEKVKEKRAQTEVIDVDQIQPEVIDVDAEP